MDARMFKNKLANASMIFFHILMCFLLLFISVFVQGNKEIFTLNKTVKNLLHHIGGFFCFVFNTHKKKKKRRRGDQGLWNVSEIRSLVVMTDGITVSGAKWLEATI